MATQFKQDPVVDYIAQNAIAQAQTQQNRLEVVKNMTAIQDATYEQFESVRAGVVADSMISAATEGFKAETDFANAKAKSILGLDPRAANYRLEELANTQKTAYNNTQEIAKTILAKQQTTIFDNPIDWISNQFTLPADIATHNYYADQHNAAESEFKSIVDAGTKVGQETRALEATTSAAKAQGELDKIAAKARFESAKIQQAGAQLNISGVKELQSLTEADLSHAAQAVSVKEAEDRAALARAQFAATQEQRAIMNEQRMKAKRDEKMVEEDELEMTAAVNAAGAADGFAPRSRSAVVAAIKRNDPGMVMALNRGYNLLQSGQDKSNVAVAKNAADAGNYYIKLNVVPKGTDASVVNFLASQLTGLEAKQDVAVLKDPEVKRQYVNGEIIKVAESQMASIKDDEANIYAAPSITSLVNAIPVLARNKFVTESLVPIANANPTAPTSANTVLAAGVAAVAADPSRLNEVVQSVAGFFTAAATANNKLKNYTNNGLPPQLGYNAVIKDASLGVARIATMDLTDPLVIRRHMMINANPKPFNRVQKDLIN